MALFYYTSVTWPNVLELLLPRKCVRVHVGVCVVCAYAHVSAPRLLITSGVT